MIPVGYDASCDALWIGFQPAPFLPRSLVVVRDGDMLWIQRRTSSEVVVAARFDQIGRADGGAFATAAEAQAYLQDLFRHWPAGAGVESMVAAADLGGQRVVRVSAPGRVVLASADDPGAAGAVIGVSLGAARAGDLVDVRTHGPLDEPTWSFPPGPAFLGLDGTLGAAPAPAGLCQAIGTFVSPTRLVVALGLPILRAP